jgi:hypothetical protein
LSNRFIFVLAAAFPLSPVSSQKVVTVPLENRHIDARLEPLYGMGDLDGPPWVQFQSLTDAAFAPDGTLFLLDAGEPAVVAVSTEGSLRFRVGSRGEGPGEYRSPQSVDVLPDGTIVVFDGAKRAFLLYDKEGVSIDEVRPDLTLGVPGAPMEVAADGTLLAFPERLLTGMHGAAMLTGAGIRSIDKDVPLLRVQLSDSGAATVMARVPVALRLEDATSLFRVFVPGPSFGVVHGTDIAIMEAEKYRIEILSPSASEATVLQRNLEGRATSATDRDAFLQQLEGESERVRPLGQGAGQRPGRGRPAPWFYPTISPATRITTNGGRSIWVQRSNPDDATEPGPIDLLSTDGRYRGTFPADGRGLPVAFGPGGLVAFFETGEFGVPTASVYRLPETFR